MNRVNTFFWARLNPSWELVRSVDALLGQLVPEDKLGHAFDTLSIAAEQAVEARARAHSRSLVERNPEGDEETGAGAGAAVVAPTTAAGQTQVLVHEACDPDFEAQPHLLEEDVSDDEPCEKTVPGELERKWAKIRAVFHGWDEDQGEREKKMDEMAELLLRHHVLEKVLLPKVLGQLTFETRKYVGHVFRAMSVHNLRGFIELIAERPDIMRWLVEGYKNNDTALICGAMLRDCFEYQTLTVIFLKELVAEFAFLFQVTIENSNFDISADAFMNISRLLTVHKKATVACLDASFDRIFGLLNGLLTAKSSNYATKRQTLQLLSELLLDPVNFTVMQRYIASRSNLKLVMLLLRETSEALRMDAFHVFKIFVANPNKSHEVEQLLVRNREKLLAFVNDFGKSESNRDFHQEKSLLIFALERMADKQCVHQDHPPAASDRSQQQVTRPASLSTSERMTLPGGTVSEVCTNHK